MFFKTSTLNEAVVVDWTIFVTKICNKLGFALKVVALNKVRLKFLSSDLLTIHGVLLPFSFTVGNR